MKGTDNQGRRLVTVDTGELGDVFPGALVTWLHTPRGGYGFTMSIPAKVLGHSLRPYTKVTIEIQKRDGTTVIRHVDGKNLRWRP